MAKKRTSRKIPKAQPQPHQLDVLRVEEPDPAPMIASVDTNSITPPPVADELLEIVSDADMQSRIAEISAKASDRAAQLSAANPPSTPEVADVPPEPEPAAPASATPPASVTPPEPTMITTANIPNSATAPPPPPQPAMRQPVPAARPVVEYRGEDLGALVRDVELTRGYQPVVRLAITFEPFANYIVEFKGGRARVPQRIADYIRAENPGGCMRLV